MWHNSNGEIEQRLTRIFQQEPDGLSWLAFLVTGDPATRLEVAENLAGNGGTQSYFRGWLTTRSRRLAIAGVLAAMKSQISESVVRSKTRDLQQRFFGSRVFSRGPERSARLRGSVPVDADADREKDALERLLFSIELFPRCAILLTICEKLDTGDAAILLNVDQQLIRKATRFGLAQLSLGVAGTNLDARTSVSVDVELATFNQLTA